MKCYHCQAANVPCVYEHLEVYEAYMLEDCTRSSHFFFTMEAMADFVESSDENTLFRLFQRNLETGEVIEFT